MPPVNKLPKYALYDFDDITEETVFSSLIAETTSDMSDETFDYDNFHIVFWPNRPPKNGTNEEILKSKQCAKILLFISKYWPLSVNTLSEFRYFIKNVSLSDDLGQLKHYRDQLADDIISIHKFPLIRKKLLSKSTVENKVPSYPGAGERQSRRLKAQKLLNEGEPAQSSSQAKKPSKSSVLKKASIAKSKKECDSSHNNTTLEMIAQQKVGTEFICISSIYTYLFLRVKFRLF